MLLPLNRPSSLVKKPSLGETIANPIFRVFGSLLKICFGWLGLILDRYFYRQFEAEIRNDLYYLFAEHGARIVPSKESRNATTVTVEFDVVQLQISRHHGETFFAVSSIFAPDEWQPFQLVVKGITNWGSSAAPFTTNLSEFARDLRKSLPFLQEALSKDNWHSTLSRAIDTENAAIDESAARARANGVEPIFYDLPSMKNS